MPQFNMGSPLDFYTVVVRPLYEEFVSNNGNIAKAVATITMAYHLYEWANNGQKFNEKRFKERYKNHAHLAAQFQIARQVANGVKHNLSNISTRSQAGFSSAFSEAFAKPLVIQDINGSKVSVDKLLKDIMDFWDEQNKMEWR